MYLIQIKYTTYGRRAQTSYLHVEDNPYVGFIVKLACKYRATRYNTLREAEDATCHCQDVSVPYNEYLVEIVDEGHNQESC